MLNTLVWLLSGWERRLCHSLLSGSSWPILNYFVVYKLSLPSESLAGFSAIIDTCFQGFSKPRPCPSPCPSPFSERPGPQTRLFLHFISLEFNLFLWTNESRLSEPYLSTLFFFFFFFCLCLGPLEIWAWAKEKQILRTFSKNAWLLSFLCLCSTHKASISMSHRSFSQSSFIPKYSEEFTVIWWIPAHF